MEKLEEKYKGLTVSFISLNKILTPAGDLVKTLLEQLTPSNPTENINYAKIVVKKYQNIIDIYSELLKIPKVLTKLDTFIKYYNLDKEHLSLTTIEKVNDLVNLQENVSTNIVSFPNM
ncbi:hypothetical protein [Spiroplasma sp. AdecLV25b]|uniref:hypothetical protein n=1 Tax=Spiroplasma sp. AdecLV25b TaxID=3027162 RepID=UPI0027DEC427|nr:hypothetical protein [Spiroplasma sp. AdecLV25b]